MKAKVNLVEDKSQCKYEYWLLSLVQGESGRVNKKKVKELTREREESSLKELEFSSTMLTLYPLYPPFPLG